jgi:hypothetical protein
MVSIVATVLWLRGSLSAARTSATVEGPRSQSTAITSSSRSVNATDIAPSPKYFGEVYAVSRRCQLNLSEFGQLNR